MGWVFGGVGATGRGGVPLGVDDFLWMIGVVAGVSAGILLRLFLCIFHSEGG